MDTRPIIEGLKKTEEALRRKIEDMKKPIAQAEEDVRAIAGAIAFYERGTVVQAAPIVTTSLSVTSAGVFGVANLRDMTHKQAAIAIAKHNGGIVKAQEAKRLMIQAGIMRPTKNSTRMVHNAIVSSGRFDRIAPGEYRLKNSTRPIPIVEGEGGSSSAGIMQQWPHKTQ